MMEDPVIAEALQVFVQICRNRQTERDDIVSADQTKHPWVFTAAIGEGWSFTLGTDATCRVVVNTEGLLYNATRTWILRQVPSWYQVREGGYHLVATSLVDGCGTQFRDEILESLLKFVNDL